MTIDTSTDSLLSKVFGKAVQPHKKSYHQLELLKLSADPCDPELLQHSIRKSSFEGLDEKLSEDLASRGFQREDEGDRATNCISVSCVVCGISAVINLKQIQNLQLPRHSPKCQFQRAFSYCNGEEKRCWSPVSYNLRNHLNLELKTTKAQVAKEMGYDDDAICTAMGVQFLRRSKGFEKAGDLVETLIANESNDEIQPLNTITGLAALISVSTDDAKSTKEKREEREPTVQNESKTKRGESKDDHFNQLLEDTRKLYYNSRCKTCYKEEADHIALPCGDLSVCRKCVVNQTWCPICHIEVEQFIRVYF